MTVLGSEYGLKELLGPRADDMEMKQEMLRAISRDGYVSMKDLHSDIDNKTAINTLDVYYTAAGLISDLITPGYATNYTLKNKTVRERLQDKY